MKIKDIKAGWVFEYRDTDGRYEYGVRAFPSVVTETFFTLSGKGHDTAGTQCLEWEAEPICHIREITRLLPKRLTSA